MRRIQDPTTLRVLAAIYEVAQGRAGVWVTVEELQGQVAHSRPIICDAINCLASAGLIAWDSEGEAIRITRISPLCPWGRSATFSH